MISVVIPLYNEEESLAALHHQLATQLSTTGKNYEILFVDDGSRDTSWSVIKSLALKDKHVKAVRFRRNFGKACGLQTGLGMAQGDYVFTMDADLQDDPAEIPRFLEKLEVEQLDVVSGWKRKRYDPWHKVGPSRIFNAMVSRLTGCRLHDHNCGFKLYRQDVVKDVTLYGELHRFVPVLAAARGFRVGEIEVNHRPRNFGVSKYGWNRMFKGFLDLLAVAARTRFGARPMHLIGGIGLCLCAISVFMIVVGLIFALLASGPSALILIAGWIGLIGGTLFLALGLSMEWHIAEMGGPWALPSIVETLGDPDQKP